MDNLNLPLDFGGSNPTCTKIFDNVRPSQETHEDFRALASNSSSRVVEEVKRLLKLSDASWSMMSFGKFIQLLIRYLMDAHDLHDVEAQMTGCLYLLELVQKNR